VAAVTIPKLLFISVTEGHSLAQIRSVWWQRGAAKSLVTDCQGILIVLHGSLLFLLTASQVINRKSLVCKILPSPVGSPSS